MLAMLGSEQLYFDDMPVVISATRLAQPLNESPVATTVIDRQMIEASGAQTIADVLRLVPGFTVGYLNGNYPVATYHGHSDRYSRRIQLIIDGRSVYLPTLSGVSWSDLVITLDDIERIEVIRGPNASTYGNNAFLAVVSIKTRHASQTPGQYLRATAGSHDTADLLYRLGEQSEKLDYRITVGTRNNSGTDLLYDDTKTDFVSYRLDAQLDLDTQLFYQGGIQDSRYGDVLENRDDADNDVDIDTAYQHVRLEHSLDDTSSISLHYYLNYTHSYLFDGYTTFSLASIDPIFSSVDDIVVAEEIELESMRHDFEFNYFYQPMSSLRLVSGLSLRADKVIADNVFDANTRDTLWLRRGFIHGEYRLDDRNLLNAGLMIEKNDISGTDTAPRLAFIHHLNTQHSMRISYSTATRTPTLWDEYGYIAIEQQLTENGGQPLNPLLAALLGGDTLNNTIIYSSGNVQSEEIESIELGWYASLLDERLLLDFKLYRDELRKLIGETDINPVPGETTGDGATSFTNVADSEIQGFEMYGDYQIDESWRLYGYFSYMDYLKARKTSPNFEDSIVGKLEESSPRRSYGAMLMKQWGNRLNTSLAIYHVSDMDWLDRTHARINPELFTHTDRSAEAYTKLDLVVRKTHKIGQNELSYALILQNMGGEHFDYTRTRYTDASFTTVHTPGSEQDPRGYFELSLMFN